MFPEVEILHDKWDNKCRRLLIMALGFEPRTFSFLKSDCNALFSDALIYKYSNSHYEINSDYLSNLLKSKGLRDNIYAIEFDRFFPSEFESHLKSYLINTIKQYDEIIIDISAMSKLLIIISIWLLKNFHGNIKIIYSEPLEYWPSQNDFEKVRKALGDNIENLTLLPSFGVHDVVRTPELASVIMQQSPNIVIAFTSFNELLIRALMSSISPTHFFLISSVPPHLEWREAATLLLHEKLIEEFPADNPRDDKSTLKRRCSTLYYHETFKILADIYIKYCYDYRIILAPTGSKMQALGAALIKCCCPDIHIEYPTPEGYLIQNYSSQNLRAIHQIDFKFFSGFIENLSITYDLNG